MGKRGRKPNPDKNKNYFGEREEQAVIDYINSNSKDEKNEIFNTILYPAFNIMIESIIRRYGHFIPDEDFEDTYKDCLSFLISKSDKYDPSKGTKAYSYYGTVCRNHLRGRVQNYNRDLTRYKDIESSMPDLIDNIRYSDVSDNNAKIASNAMDLLGDRLELMLKTPEKFNLKQNEIILGKALKNLIENWDYVLTTDGSQKLNKNAVWLFLRENTGFDTKSIRDNMKKFKNEYYKIKEYLVK